MNGVFNLKKYYQNIIVRNGIYSSLEFLSITLLSLIFISLFVNHLGIEDYGLWSVSTAIVGILGIANFGMGDTIIRYVASYNSDKDYRKINDVISSALVISIIFSSILIFFVYLAIPKISHLLITENVTDAQLQRIFRLSILGFFPNSIRGLMVSIPNGFQNYKFSALFNTFCTVVNYFLSILIIFLKGRVIDVITTNVILSFIFCIISILLAYHFLLSHQVRFRFSTNIDHVKQLLNFSFFVWLTGIGNVMFSLLDRIVVSMVLGLSAAGYYSIGIGVASKLPGIGSAFSKALMPAVSAWNTNNKKSFILKKLTNATIVTSIISISISSLLILIAKPLLTVWLGQKTAISVLPIMRILIDIYTISPCVAPAYFVANGLGYPWINAIATFLSAGLTIALIFLLGPKFGLLGAGIANGAYIFLLLPLIFVFQKLSASSRLETA